MNIELFQHIRSLPRNSQISEMGTIFHFIMPLFESLDWKSGMTNSIIFEDTTSTKKRVDIKFLGENGGNSFFLEAKKIGVELSNRDFEQLTTYLNSDDKTEIGILTNGIDYWIADNSVDGGLSNKKIYSFSIDNLSSCDLEILEYFRYPLKKFDKLRQKIELENLKKELEEDNCNTIIFNVSNKKLDNLGFFSLEYSKEDFKTHSEFFKKKIDLAIRTLNSNNHNLDKFFQEIGTPFSKEKPPRGAVFLQEWNIYITVHNNIKTREKLLNKIGDYMKSVGISERG